MIGPGRAASAHGQASTGEAEPLSSCGFEGDFEAEGFKLADVVAFLATTDAGAIVRGRNTGTLARIIQTGNAVRGGQVRVRFEFARDLGDAAGSTARRRRAPTDIRRARRRGQQLCNRFCYTAFVTDAFTARLSVGR